MRRLCRIVPRGSGFAVLDLYGKLLSWHCYECMARQEARRQASAEQAN